MKSDAHSGRIDVGPGRVWYQRMGTGPSLVLLHGGPAADFGYLEPLLSPADDEYTAVIHGQLGSFRSDKPDDPSLWDVDRFVKELETVRTTLELGQMHLLGQSWGAFLALE